VDRAAALDYKAVAITVHDRQVDVTRLAAYGRERGVVVIPGIERTICGKHVLMLNFPACAERVASFEELAQLRARTRGLVVAPHPFYPAPSCLRGLLDRYRDLFDAVELNAFYTRWIDFNQPALAWAKAHGKPVVGNADVHRLSQLGRTFSVIDAPPDAEAICDAIRAGRVEVRTEPLSVVEAATYFGSLMLSGLRPKPQALRPEREAVRLSVDPAGRRRAPTSAV
jgi:predicted metal-dependent phosphoesterase TrpH